MNITELQKFKHKPFNYKPNRLQLEPNEFTFEERDTFNEIYQLAKQNFIPVEPTKSGGIPFNKGCKFHSRYLYIQSSTKIELIIVSYVGMYRFVIGNKRNVEQNPISGKKAVRELYKIAKEMNVDLSKFTVDTELGKRLKRDILAPHIQMFGQEQRVYTNVHHFDLNSSYASRIIEHYPELKSFYEYIYSKRNENDNYYKHVLTNSIGCFQSEYCPDYYNGGKIAPFQLTKLALIAVNDTKEMINQYIDKLQRSGRTVLLTNTDGIWYQGELFHDENENDKLGGWKNDHKNCTFIMKSKGAYQFIENGITKTVVRGITDLDKEKSRDEWKFGDIFTGISMKYYSFDKEKGVIENVKKI